MTTRTKPPPTATVRPSTSASAATPPPQSATAPRTTQTAGASDVRIPATFVITAHGSVNPSTISTPAGVTIQLRIVAGDGGAHRVLLRTRPAEAFSVAAGGPASAQLTGLRNGRYELDVDGARAGTLVVGAQPGP